LVRKFRYFRLTSRIVETVLIKERPLVRRQDPALFIGREKDVETLSLAVDAGFNTLVVGAPGSGKTSLLAQTSFRLLDDRLHRVEFVTAPANSTGPELAEAIATELVGPRDHLFDPISGAVLGNKTHEAVSNDRAEMTSAIRRMARLVDQTVGGDEDGPWYMPDEDVVVFVDGASAKGANAFFIEMRDQLARIRFQWVVSADTRAGETVAGADGMRFFDGIHQIADFTPDVAAAVISSRLEGRAPSSADLARVLRDERYTARAVVTLAREIYIGGVERVTGSASSDEKRAAAWQAVNGMGRQATVLAKELEARGPTSASDEDLLGSLGWSRSRISEIFSDLLKAGWVTYTTEQGEHGGRPRKLYRLADELR
jgi:hypothetical protein